MTKAHRCYYCQRASKNVERVLISDSVCTELRWVCRAVKQCMKRQSNQGKQFLMLKIGNPPKKKRAA